MQSQRYRLTTNSYCFPDPIETFTLDELLLAPCNDASLVLRNDV